MKTSIKTTKSVNLNTPKSSINSNSSKLHSKNVNLPSQVTANRSSSTLFPEESPKSGSKVKRKKNKISTPKIKEEFSIEEPKKKLNKIQKTTEIKLLNQGTYGCIFTPEINCDDGTVGSVKYISKIQKHNKGLEYELVVSSKVKEIHNYYFYYAVLIKECNAILSSISEKEIKKCNVLKAIPVNSTKENKYTSTKIRYVGKNSLEKYLKLLYLELLPKTESGVGKFYENENESKLNNSSSELTSKINGGGIFDFFTKPAKQEQTLPTIEKPNGPKNLEQNKNTNETKTGFFGMTNLLEQSVETPHQQREPSILIKKIKHTYSYLLFSLQKLNSNGIVHNDIKENNIMIDDNTNNPILIDFNLSFLMENISNPVSVDSSKQSEEESLNSFIESLKRIFFYSKFYLYYSIDFYILVYIVNDIFSKVRSGKPIKEDKVDLQKLKIIVELFFINLYNKSKQFNFHLFSSGFSNNIKQREVTQQEDDEKNIDILSAKDIENDLLLEPIIENIEQESPEFVQIKNKFIDYFQKTYQEKTWQDLFNDLTKPETLMTWDNYSLAIIYLITTTSPISSYLSVSNNNSIFSLTSGLPTLNSGENVNNFQTSIEENSWINLWKDIVFSLPNERMTPIQTMEKVKFL